MSLAAFSRAVLVLVCSHTFNTMETPVKTYRIATIPGDGIGKEVVPAGQQVLEAIAARSDAFQFEFENFDWGGDFYRQHGVMMPADGLDAIRNKDAILFGSAANFEEEAAHPHAPKGAAGAAHLLYKRVAEYFPDSPLAPEAAWRAADIRWQIDKLDISTLPSAKEQEAYLRPQLYEGELKKVMKTYPGSRFAAMAAFDLIDNKLCGDWQGLPKCPEMETGLYQKYAQQYPDGPKSAEALYNAVYRQGVVVTMYAVQEDRKRSQAAAQRTQALAQELKEKYPKSDYAVRGVSIAFRVSQGIPIYGSDRD